MLRANMQSSKIIRLPSPGTVQTHEKDGSLQDMQLSTVLRMHRAATSWQAKQWKPEDLVQCHLKSASCLPVGCTSQASGLGGRDVAKPCPCCASLNACAATSSPASAQQMRQCNSHTASDGFWCKLAAPVELSSREIKGTAVQPLWRRLLIGC